MTKRVTRQIPRSQEVEHVRHASLFELDASAGRIQHVRTVSKFGSNSAVGTGAYEDVWEGGGAYNWLTAAAPLRVKAGGNAADDSAGAGARTVVVQGLDEDFSEISETLTTAGGSASSPTSLGFIRVNRAYVDDSGAYGAANTGAISIETTGGTTVAHILAAYGQTEQAIYTVPAGWTAYLSRLEVAVDAGTNKTAAIRIWQRPGADVTSAPFKSPRIVDSFQGVSGEVIIDHESYISFAEKTDIWADAIGESNATEVEVIFDLFLLENT